MTFVIGQLVMTNGVAAVAKNDVEFYRFLWKSIARFRACDWGDLCEEDKAMNDCVVKNGDDRIVAKYENEIDNIYIITERDRSVTTILLIDEY